MHRCQNTSQQWTASISRARETRVQRKVFQAIATLNHQTNSSAHLHQKNSEDLGIFLYEQRAKTYHVHLKLAAFLPPALCFSFAFLPIANSKAQEDAAIQVGRQREENQQQSFIPIRALTINFHFRGQSLSTKKAGSPTLDPPFSCAEKAVHPTF